MRAVVDSGPGKVVLDTNVFRSEYRFAGATNPQEFSFVPDPADRKFAALAEAVQAPLVTSDAGLLKAGGQMAVPVFKPSEFAITRSSQRQQTIVPTRRHR